MNSKRESNFELMRIICMFMIVITHTLGWGGVANVSSPNIVNYINLIYAIILVEVNAFVLLTGYFQSDSNFRLKKIVNMLLIMYFYKFLITLVGYVFGWYELSTSQLLWNLSPFDFSNYWFLKLYVVLYFLSPFINKIIKNMNRTMFKRLLIIIFIFCSVIVSITNQELFTNCNGYSLVQFVFMYLIGAYLRIYIINNKTKTELYKNKTLLLGCIFICISIFILSFITNYSLFRIGKYLMNKDGFLYFIGNRIKTPFMAYDNSLVILGSVGFFLFFSLINFKSKIINKLSSSIMSVYIIHETVIFRSTLYSWFGLNKLQYVSSYRIFAQVFIIALCIFMGSIIIDFIRRLIVKFLNFIICKFNLFKVLRNKILSIENSVNLWMNI